MKKCLLAAVAALALGSPTIASARDINSPAEFETVWTNAIAHAQSHPLVTRPDYRELWDGDGYWAAVTSDWTRQVCFAHLCFNEHGRMFETDLDGYATRGIRERWPGETPPDLFAATPVTGAPLPNRAGGK
jgi:hypothetical protein